MATVVQKPAAPTELTPYSMAEYKSQLRVYDAARIQAGVPAAQIQRENSIFPEIRSARVVGRLAVSPVVARLAAGM
jgi:hypothetical protein